MLRVFPIVLVVVLTSGVVTQVPMQLVRNGGFERGLADWQLTGQAGYTFIATQNVYSGTSALATKPLTKPDYGLTVPTRQGAYQQIMLAQPSLSLELSFAVRVENHNSRTEAQIVLLLKGTRTWALMYFLAYDQGFVQTSRYSNQTAKSIFLVDIQPIGDPQWNTWLTFTRDIKLDVSAVFSLQDVEDSHITSIEIMLDTISYGTTFNEDVTTWDEISLVQKQTIQTTQTTVPATTITQIPTQTTVVPATTRLTVLTTTVPLSPPRETQTFVSIPVVAVGILALVAALLAVYLLMTRRK